MRPVNKNFILGLMVGSVLTFLFIVVSSPQKETRDQEIFVYGTLTNPIIRIYACWCLTEAEPASLADYTKDELNIYYEDGSKVDGRLIKVSESELARIDRYEGVPQKYQRIKVDLNGELVWAYQK